MEVATEDEADSYITQIERRSATSKRLETLDPEETDGSFMERLSQASSPKLSSSPLIDVRNRRTSSDTEQLDSSPPIRRSSDDVGWNLKPVMKPMLSGMVMNQLVNIAISASRAKAALNDMEASRMFRIWHTLVSGA